MVRTDLKLVYRGRPNYHRTGMRDVSKPGALREGENWRYPYRERGI